MNRQEREWHEYLGRMIERHSPQMKFFTEPITGGRFDGASGMGMKAKEAGATFCDFCEAPNTVKEYPARDIVIPIPNGGPDAPPMLSRGGWGACAACAELIDLGARDRLLKRVFDLFVGRFDADTPPELREEVRGQQRRNFQRMQAAFWKARIVD